LPCCQSAESSDAGGLAGWLDAALAVDVTRAAKLKAAGYDVHTQTIPVTITPKNRLLLGEPALEALSRREDARDGSAGPDE
jgi:hypothetical protein